MYTQFLLVGATCMTKLNNNLDVGVLGRRTLLRAAVTGVAASAGLSTMRLWGADIDRA